MLKDKFLVQTVALTTPDEEYPPAQATQLVRDAQALEQQGSKKEAEDARSKAEALQHEQWEAFKASKRVTDSKIGLNFIEAARASSAAEDDVTKPPAVARSLSNTPSTHDAVGGGAASKGGAPGLGRGSSVSAEDGMSADLLADNSRLRAQLESQKEILAQTTEALEALKSQLDLRSRKNVENMSDAEFAKAAASISGTVYDKKTEVQAPSSPALTVQVRYRSVRILP
jgi:hypothetical protein